MIVNPFCFKMFSSSDSFIIFNYVKFCGADLISSVRISTTHTRLISSNETFTMDSIDRPQCINLIWDKSISFHVLLLVHSLFSMIASVLRLFFYVKDACTAAKKKRTCFNNVSRSANLNAFAEQENTGFDETAYAEESQTEQGHVACKCWQWQCRKKLQ